MQIKKSTAKMRFPVGKMVMFGVLAVALGACVDPYPPPHHGYYYSNGYYDGYDDHYYSTYDYPQDNRSAYSGDYETFRARREADERNGWGHSDDRNFHNRDDYDSYDR